MTTPFFTFLPSVMILFLAFPTIWQEYRAVAAQGRAGAAGTLLQLGIHCASTFGWKLVMVDTGVGSPAKLRGLNKCFGSISFAHSLKMI